MKTPKFKRKKHIEPIDKSIESKIKNVSIYISIFTLIVGILTFPFNKYANYFLVLLFIIPFVSLIFIRSSGKLFDIGFKSKDRLSIFLFPLMISFLFLISRTYSIHILEFRNIFIATFIFTGIIILLMVFKNDEFYENGKLSWSSIPALSVFPLIFSYSLSVNLNYTFDYLKPKIYLSKVKYKRESKRKNIHYKFVLESIDKYKVYNEFSVSQELYENCSINDTVTLKIYTGLLNAPFYKVVEK